MNLFLSQSILHREYIRPFSHSMLHNEHMRRPFQQDMLPGQLLPTPSVLNLTSERGGNHLWTFFFTEHAIYTENIQYHFHTACYITSIWEDYFNRTCYLASCYPHHQFLIWRQSVVEIIYEPFFPTEHATQRAHKTYLHSLLNIRRQFQQNMLHSQFLPTTTLLELPSEGGLVEIICKINFPDSVTIRVY